jgi:hypothetical protein
MAIALRYSYEVLVAKVAGKYGLYMSKKMVAALHAYRDYRAARKGGTASAQAINTAEMDLINAWYIWSSTKEFRKTDTRTNGLLTALAVEIGAIPNVDRESNTTAFVLTGKLRVNPVRRRAAQVQVTDQTVPAYLDSLAQGGGHYAVVVIDAFGGGDSQQANGFNRRYGNQASTVLENIEAVLDTAKEHGAAIINVTMGAEKTWKCLSDRFSSTVINVVKPAQPLFKGSGTYTEDTRQQLADTGATTFVVVGWDANQCVAAAIFGVEPANQPYVPGLLDFGWTVVTSRNLLGANLDNALESRWGWPHIAPSPPRAIGLTQRNL